jgi:hypothetical protein
LRETFAAPRSWLLMLSLGLVALPMGTYLAHLQPMLRAQHFDIRTAAALGCFLSTSLDPQSPFWMAVGMVFDIGLTLGLDDRRRRPSLRHR